MPLRRYDRDAAVAENVVVALELLHRVLRLEARAEWCRPFVFGLLHQEHGLRKQLDIADVIGMGMRHRDVSDVTRLDAELLERRGERLGTAPVCHPRIGR